ncbi:MAG: hypothetical protein J7L23_02385 [Candidatus Diapherotrites archaeon]|nr:hypothetical protein [Candidatus Diapherotrites archaeon]
MIKIFKVNPEANSKVQSVLGQDPFARNEYIYRDGTTLGLDTRNYYLYINAPEEFFKENEEQLKIEGVEEVEKEEFDEIKEKIEKEQENVATGLSLFD